MAKHKNKWQPLLLPLLAGVLLLGQAALVVPGWLAARATPAVATLSGPLTETPALALPAGEFLVTATYLADTVEDASLVLAPAANSDTTAAGWQPLALHKSSSGVASGLLTLAQPGTVSFAVVRPERVGAAADADAENTGVHLTGLEISAAPVLRQRACHRLALFALVDAALLGAWLIWRCRRHPDFGRKLAVVAVLALTVVVATGPLLGGNAWHGSDLGYHLRRIENIATGLSAGQFPVKIQPNWVNGYGYAVGVFYGDLFLYLPAVLRILGFGVTEVYIGYLAAVNLATALLAYLCFCKMGGSRAPALGAAVLYTLAPYRLCNLYTRAALGEYTALAFLPVVALGIYRVYRDAPGQKRRLPGWLLLALGMGGILQSHLLSLEMTALVLGALALCLLPKTLSKPVLGRLFGAVGAFLALNAGFLIPFLDYYLTGKFEINQPGGTEAIQQNGALPAQLFGLPVNAAAEGVQQNLVQNMALTPGVGLWCAALLLVVLLGLRAAGLGRGGRAAQKPALPAAVVPGVWGLAGGVLLAFAATTLFPWDGLYHLGGGAGALVGSLQFPWRLLGLAALLLSLAAMAAFGLLRPRPVRWGVPALLCALCLVSAVRFNQSYTAGAQPVNFYYGTEEYNWQMSCEHYLPTEQGALDSYNLPEGPQWGEGVAVSSCLKNGTTLTLTAENTGTAPAGVRLPLLYYKGYTAKDTATGQRLRVENGTNNSVTVVLPAGYGGSAQVYFAEPWYWRAGELVSALAVLGLGAGMEIRRRRSRHDGGTGGKDAAIPPQG